MNLLLCTCRNPPYSEMFASDIYFSLCFCHLHFCTKCISSAREAFGLWVFLFCSQTNTCNELNRLYNMFTYIITLLGLLHYEFSDHGWTKFYQIRKYICSSRSDLQIVHSLGKWDQFSRELQALRTLRFTRQQNSDRRKKRFFSPSSPSFRRSQGCLLIWHLWFRQ